MIQLCSPQASFGSCNVVYSPLPEKNSPISTEDNRTQVEESRGQWQRSETSEIRCLGTLREASEGWSNFAVIRAA